MIHAVKGFGVVNKAEVDDFLELFCFFDDPMDVGNLISGSSAFSKSIIRLKATREVPDVFHINCFTKQYKKLESKDFQR